MQHSKFRTYLFLPQTPKRRLQRGVALCYERGQRWTNWVGGILRLHGTIDQLCRLGVNGKLAMLRAEIKPMLP